MTGLYSTSRWTKRRAYQLRHEPLCRKCQALGILTPASVADHVIPHRGSVSLFWSGELQSLCKQCHDSAKQLQETRGYSMDLDSNGLPTDPLHPYNRGYPGG